jgi:hypothetical protein
MDKGAFFDQMKALGAALGKKVEQDTIEQYFKIFGHLQDFQFERVCNKAKNTCESFPRPVELHRISIDLGYVKERHPEDSTRHLISVECSCGYSFVVDPARLKEDPHAFIRCASRDCKRSFHAAFILNGHVGGFLSIHPDFEEYFKGHVPDGTRPDIDKLQEQMEFR